MGGNPGITFRLEDLPPRLREQAEAQMAVPRRSNPQRLPDIHSIRKPPASSSFRVARPPEPTPRRKPNPEAPKQPRSITAGRGVPNRTEADYNNSVLGGAGLYEPVVLRLPGGNYTPDWMTVDPKTHRITFHEVKGSYRFPIESRAMLAFRSAAASFPVFRFVWAQRQKGGKWVVKHVLNDDAAEGRA